MVSDFWGSVFIDDLTDVVPDGPGGRRANTAFGSLIAKYSDICVPSIEYLAGEIDFKYLYRKLFSFCTNVYS